MATKLEGGGYGPLKKDLNFFCGFPKICSNRTLFLSLFANNLNRIQRQFLSGSITPFFPDDRIRIRSISIWNEFRMRKRNCTKTFVAKLKNLRKTSPGPINYVQSFLQLKKPGFLECPLIHSSKGNCLGYGY